MRLNRLISIVIKSDIEVDPTKKLGPELHGSTRKNKKIFQVLIFHMKKLRNNPYEYKLDML